MRFLLYYLVYVLPRLIFFRSFLGGLSILIIYVVGYCFSSETELLFKLSWGTAVLWIIFALRAFLIAISNDKRWVKIMRFSRSYYWSIGAALAANNPEQVISELGYAVKDLELYGINKWSPYYWTQNGSVNGCPNYTHLKEVIVTTITLKEEWENLTPIERNRAMSELRQHIEKEYVWMAKWLWDQGVRLKGSHRLLRWKSEAINPFSWWVPSWGIV
jgi:hypothetical protein